MGKAVGKILKAAAAIAIPFVAPPIAGAIGLSSAIGSAIGSVTAGSIIGSGITGAALGAGVGALTGQNIGKSALFGALGGGLAGYGYARSLSAPTNVASNTSSIGLTNAKPMSIMRLAASGATSTKPMSTLGLAATGMTPTGFTTAPGLTLSSSAPIFATATKGPSFLQALKQVPSAIAAKFSDPRILADLTLRAAGQLAGSAIAGEGLTPEEQKLLAAQTEDLKRLREQNEELFKIRLQEAQNLLGDAKYFDPEYFGLQSARRAQIVGAQAARAGLRGLTGDAYTAEKRRYDLDTARNMGTAYHQGYQYGLSNYLQTKQTGLNMLPSSYPSYSADYISTYNLYDRAANRRRQQQQDIGTLFGSLTGRGGYYGFG